jgi:hypothetical protein
MIPNWQTNLQILTLLGFNIVRVEVKKVDAVSQNENAM